MFSRRDYGALDSKLTSARQLALGPLISSQVTVLPRERTASSAGFARWHWHSAAVATSPRRPRETNGLTLGNRPTYGARCTRTKFTNAPAAAA